MSTVIDTIEPTFISTGYANWKDALVKKRGFAAYEQSHCYKHAVTCVVTIPAASGDVGELINEKYAEEKAVSRQSLLKILSNIPFLASQALSLRSDGKGEPSSNFSQLLPLTRGRQLFLMEWAKRKGSNYTSHDMQEELLKVMALKIFRDIAAEIRSAEFCAIRANQTFDISKIQQLVI